MERIRILYLSGIILVGALTIFIYSQILNPAASQAPDVEHYTVLLDEKSLIGFKIHNKAGDWNYTFAIFLNDSKLTGDSPVFIRANQTFQYSMELPNQTEGRINVLIYRGREKTLIENKTYYLGLK